MKFEANQNLLKGVAYSISAQPHPQTSHWHLHGVERQLEGVQVVEGVGLVLFNVKTILPLWYLLLNWHFPDLPNGIQSTRSFIKLDDNFFSGLSF